MTALGEASRLYQATLEGERRFRTEFQDVVSAGDLLVDAGDELRDARAALEVAYLDAAATR